MAKKIDGYIKLQVPAGAASPSPPVGPALGQHGLNLMDFCNAFNAKTSDTEKGLPVPVVITVYEDKTFDFVTNLYKFAATVSSVGYSDTPKSAGNNLIEEQCITMKMPISPAEAANKKNTDYSTIGLALNGVSFFNENVAPGDQITNELFTFDQCSGHPQQHDVYHYHVDPVCLIRDL